MTLGEFRKQTKNMSDDLELEIYILKDLTTAHDLPNLTLIQRGTSNLL
jgi:hypothetical protein